MDEPKLKRLLQLGIEKDFDILPEVTGTNIVEHDEVRIDFMCYPKQHIIDAGFHPAWFGIEVKHIPQKDDGSHTSGTTSKITRLFWQAISYAQSEFNIENQNIRPAFVLVHTNRIQSRGNQSLFRNLTALGLYGNVGVLDFFVGKRKGWMITFARYYAFHDNNGIEVYQQMLPKRRVGSI